MMECKLDFAWKLLLGWCPSFSLKLQHGPLLLPIFFHVPDSPFLTRDEKCSCLLASVAEVSGSGKESSGGLVAWVGSLVPPLTWEHLLEEGWEDVSSPCSRDYYCGEAWKQAVMWWPHLHSMFPVANLNNQNMTVFDIIYHSLEPGGWTLWWVQSGYQSTGNIQATLVVSGLKESFFDKEKMLSFR